MSWQYALLLPRCVRPTSSPETNIGTPCERSRIAAKFLICRRRARAPPGSSVSPSMPQFQLLLSSTPSRLPSPLASLCFSLYETRSYIVKPSWAVTKLMLFDGPRPIPWYMSMLPDIRVAIVGDEAEVAADEAADVVAEAAVPLRPARPREPADVVEAAGVPRLRDHLRLRELLGELDAPHDRREDIGAPSEPRCRTEPSSNRNPSTCISSTQ